MEWSQIIAPDSISGLFIMLGTVGAAIIASLSIRTYKERKSYDLFTAKRLRTYDCALKTYQNLMAISASEYILKAISNSKEKYLADYEMAYAKLYGVLSTVGKQEYYLLREYELLRKEVHNYIESPTTETKKALNDQRDRIKYFTDIYLWTLWNYIQRLHKRKSEDEYHDFYDEQFEKIFARSRDLNASETTLFKDYKIDMLIDHCPYKSECSRYRRCKRKNKKH